MIPPMLRCATIVVSDVEATAARYGQWLDYRTICRGVVERSQAAAWGAPESAGRRWVLCQPASRAPVFLRFVEGDPVPAYRPIASFGWAATELCVIDVEEVHARLAGSPFAVLGPPSAIGGLPTIKAMQVRGPDDETTYLTQILTEDTDAGLPRAGSPIDHLFILVLACRDMSRTARWFGETLGLSVSQPVSIRYSMINQAFKLPVECRHAIATARFDGRILLEFDQYPDRATERPSQSGALPPGVAIGTLWHPDFRRLNVDWIVTPAQRTGPLYEDRLTGTIRTPEGALVELIDGDATPVEVR